MKKKIMLVLLCITMVLSTGCTKYMKSDEKKAITNKETGQNLTANILCLPEDDELLKIYKENEKSMTVKLNKLPACDDFKPNAIAYSSIWETIFVKPLAFLILLVGRIVKNYGLSVMILGLLIRIILIPITKKTTMQSENMKKAQPKLKKLEEKYKDKNDQQSMMMKSQEMMAIYKEYDIKPLAGCLTSLIQLPLFFAFLEAINRIPAVFEEKLFGLQLGTTPLKGIAVHNYLYIILIALIILTTYFSFKMSMGNMEKTTSLTNTDNNQPTIDPMKQSQVMMKVMLIFISIASLSLPAAIGLYWIVTNAFAVGQNIILKKRKN